MSLGGSEIGAMVVKVTADTRSLVDKIQRDAVSSGRSSGAAWGKGFATVGIAAAAAGLAIGAATVGVAAFGLKVASANQQAAVSFETLMGKGEKTEKFLKDLAAFAAKTPFELPELRDAAARLVATGVEAGRVIPIMEALGDSTAAMGTGTEGISRAVTALQQMSNAGRVTGGDMNQLASAGIPAWNALAASIGIAPAKVRELVSQGKVSVEQLLTAIEDKTGSTFAKVSGTMEAQSATFAGQISTLKDTLSQTLGTAAEPLLKALQGALPSVTDAVSGLVGGLEPMFTSIGDLAKAATPLLKPLGEALGKIGGSVITAVADGFAALAPAVEILAPALGEIGEVLGGAIGTVFEALAPLMPPLVQAVVDLAMAFMPLVPLVADVVTLLLPFVGILTAGLEVITPIVAAIVEFVAQNDALKIGLAVITAAFIAWNIALNANPIGIIILAIVGLIGAIKLLWENNETFRNIVTAAWNGIQTAVQAVVGWFMEYVWPTLSTVIGWIVAYYKMLWEAAKIVWSGIKTAIELVVGWFMDYVWPVISQVIDWIKAYYEGLFTVVKYVWGVIQRAIEVVVRWFMDTAWPVIQQVIDNLKTGFEVLKAGIKVAWDRIQTVIKGVVDWFMENVYPKIKPVLDLIGTAMETLKGVIETVWNGVITFMGGIVDKFLGIGTAIVEGIKTGISNAWNGFTAWVEEKINELPEAVKFILGIASPSKVFAQIGGNVVDGFQIGLKGLDGVTDSVAAKFTNMAKQSEDRINAWVQKQKTALDEAIRKWKDYRNAVFSAVTGNVNIASAWEQTDAQQKAVADAQAAYDAAARAAAGPDASQSDKDAATAALAALDQAKAAVRSFEGNIGTMLDESNLFGTMFEKASAAMIAQFGADSPVWQMLREQMLTMSPQAGAAMAQYLAENGLTPEMAERLTTWNAWAGGVADAQAQINEGQGVAMAASALAGVDKEILREQARLTRMGGSIGDGLIVGFDGKIPGFRRAVRRYIDAAMEELGISSPSTVFAEIGSYTAQGFNAGWDGAIMDTSGLVPTPEAYRNAVSSASVSVDTAGMIAPQVRVFIGDRELTDIVDVQIGKADEVDGLYVASGRRV